VTFGATANTSHARKTGNSALMAALAITAIAAAMLAGAWFFQLMLDLRPCPLCLEQRYAYYLAIPLGALTALAAAREAPRAVLVLGLAILAAAALGNAWLGTFHAGVEWGSGRGRPIAPGRSGISAAPATSWSASTPSRWSAATRCSGSFSACRWPDITC
jgi:disulfide bond formation protein DsbB